MPVTERDRSRLAALIAIVRPARSLAARVETLNDEQRNWYDGWNAYWSAWIKRNDRDDGNAYGLTLRGYGPCELRADIATIIHGPIPCILVTASEDQAQQIFREECER